jgi:hypothetical protein
MGEGARIGRTGLLALLAAAVALACAGSASASPFVWSGHGSTWNWSEASNWQGSTVPAESDGIVDLEFPLSACPGELRECPQTTDDLSGLSIGTITLDARVIRFTAENPLEPFPQGLHPLSYEVKGSEPLRLAHGLDIDVSEEGEGEGILSSGGTYLSPPVVLTGSNSWTVGPGMGSVLDLSGTVGGAHPLSIELGDNELELLRSVETGPLTITGGRYSTVIVGELLAAGDLNGQDREPVALHGASLLGSGETGPLTVDGGQLDVGEAHFGADLDVHGALTLEHEAIIGFEVPAPEGSGSYKAVVDGHADLGGARLELGERCPPAGSTYTLLEAAGGVSGSFTGIDGMTIQNGQTIGGEPEGCGHGIASLPLRIEYLPESVVLTTLGATSTSTSTSTSQTSIATTVSAGGGVSAYSVSDRTLLAGDLSAAKRIRSIGLLLRRKGETILVHSPRAGLLSLEWHALVHGHNRLIASGSLSFSAAAAGHLHIVLTRAGRQALKHAERLKVIVDESFSAASAATLVSKSSLLLRR